MNDKTRIVPVLQCLLLVIPLNIYVIGDWLASGVQGALFRYQESSLGNSLILLTRDLHYVTTGLLAGSTAASAILWMTGTVLLALGLVLVICALSGKGPSLVRQGAVCTIAAGVLYGISQVVQYGILLHGEKGFCVPVGIPVILAIGIWIYRQDFGIATGADDPAEPVVGKDE